MDEAVGAVLACALGVELAELPQELLVAVVRVAEVVREVEAVGDRVAVVVFAFEEEEQRGDVAAGALQDERLDELDVGHELEEPHEEGGWFLEDVAFAERGDGAVDVYKSAGEFLDAGFFFELLAERRKARECGEEVVGTDGAAREAFFEDETTHLVHHFGLIETPPGGLSECATDVETNI